MENPVAADLLEMTRRYGQHHLLAGWDKLAAAEQQALAEQIQSVDFARLAELFRGEQKTTDWSELAARAAPPAAFRLDDAAPRFSPAQALARGEQALGDGKLGMILVAGGQGTRLGFHQPKGLFPIGPVSGRTLFQVLIDHLRAVARRYGTTIPLYLMTSPATHEDTLACMRENDRFGLAETDLKVFCQGTMPAVDDQTGRVLLSDPATLALSPDGHGGMLAALERSGCLADAQRRGIEQLFYGQVDNPLVQVCHPRLIGYHLLSASELTTQVVHKVDPVERVGNVVSIDGQTQIIEYSDLPAEAARQTNPDGSLKLWAGNIAVHVFDVAFLDRAKDEATALPFHLAHKQVAYIDETGQQISPTEPNAIKFERFIFDLLPLAQNAIVVEGDKRECFAPVKNADGAATDTPAAARQAMMDLHRSWLTTAGVTVARGASVEISPFFALDAEQLRQRMPSGKQVTEDTYLDE